MKIKREKCVDVHVRLITTHSEFNSSDITEEALRKFEEKAKSEFYQMIDRFRIANQNGTCSVRAVFAGVSDGEWS